MKSISTYRNLAVFFCSFIGASLTSSVYGQPKSELSQKENVQYLYVSNRNSGRDNEQSDFISQYKVQADGTLVPLSPRDVTAGKGLLYIITEPSGRFLYSVNTLDYTISQYRIQYDGRLAPLTPATVSLGKMYLENICVHPNGGFLYALRDQGISAYKIAPTGTLSPLRAPDVTAEGTVEDMVFDKTALHAYAADDRGNVYQYNVRQDGVTVQIAPPLHTGAQDQSLTLSSSGQFLYDVTFSPYTVRTFKVNDDATLSALPDFTLSLVEDPMKLVFDTSGKFGYIVITQGKVCQFHLGPDGRLKALPDLKPPVEEPVGVVFSPKGPYAYLLSNNGAIVQYRVGNDGQLVPLKPDAVVMLGAHTTLVTDATGRFAYVSGDLGSYTIAQYKFNPHGTLSPLSPPTVNAGTNPFSMVVVTR